MKTLDIFQSDYVQHLYAEAARTWLNCNIVSNLFVIFEWLTYCGTHHIFTWMLCLLFSLINQRNIEIFDLISVLKQNSVKWANTGITFYHQGLP